MNPKTLSELEFTIHRTLKSENFTMLDNDLLRNTALSVAARGTLIVSVFSLQAAFGSTCSAADILRYHSPRSNPSRSPQKSKRVRRNVTVKNKRSGVTFNTP
jgi:hypothetical protein